MQRNEHDSIKSIQFEQITFRRWNTVKLRCFSARFPPKLSSAPMSLFSYNSDNYFHASFFVFFACFLPIFATMLGCVAWHFHGLSICHILCTQYHTAHRNALRLRLSRTAHLRWINYVAWIFNHVLFWISNYIFCKYSHYGCRLPHRLHTVLLLLRKILIRKKNRSQFACNRCSTSIGKKKTNTFIALPALKCKMRATLLNSRSTNFNAKIFQQKKIGLFRIIVWQSVCRLFSSLIIQSSVRTIKKNLIASVQTNQHPIIFKQYEINEMRWKF